MDHVVSTYENYKEEDRLTTNNARKVEYLTTIKVLDELFSPKVKVLDCAAGTGIYAFYLADRGFEVTATDITPRHIELINNELENKPYAMDTAVMDAADLSKYENETFDIVLNMGPYYHLINESAREKNLLECKRVLKCGGLLITAYINRYYVFPAIALSDEKFMKKELADGLIQTGTLLHNDPNCFWTDSYYATPNEMEAVYQNMGLQVIDHVATDGIAPLLREKIDILTQENFEIWFHYHYSVCREKSILGMSNHGLIIGKNK